MDPFIGQIVMFGGNFAPRGWALCDGQLLSINQNSALFSILGTIYGGDGRTNFGLPDLRGRNPVHPGNGPGLDAVRLGQKGGANRYTLTTAQLPSHDHTGNVVAEGAAATEGNPTNNFLGVVTGTDKIYEADGAGAIVNMATGSIKVNPAGGNQPYQPTDPYLAVNFIIALQGVFPSRS